MTCPECQAKTKVLETRHSPHGTRRRRACRACEHRFTTFELPVLGLLTQRAHVDVEVNADEVAREVVDTIENEFGEMLDELPGGVVEALLEEAQAHRGLTNGHRPELVAGDYEEDE
jgi:hypothetical protein